MDDKNQSSAKKPKTDLKKTSKDGAKAKPKTTRKKKPGTKLAPKAIRKRIPKAKVVSVPSEPNPEVVEETGPEFAETVATHESPAPQATATPEAETPQSEPAEKVAEYVPEGVPQNIQAEVAPGKKIGGAIIQISLRIVAILIGFVLYLLFMNHSFSHGFAPQSDYWILWFCSVAVGAILFLSWALLWARRIIFLQ